MNIRWVCEKCKKKSIYPIDKCLHCNGSIKQEIGNDFKVAGITKINIASISHPITPYYTLLLKDENGNILPRKTMKEYKIGDRFFVEKAKTDKAVSIIKTKYDLYLDVKEALEILKPIDVKGKKILIKPSVMSAAYPYMGITTNPYVLGYVIKWLIENGAEKKDMVIAETVQFGDFDKAMAKSGIIEVAKRFGIEIKDISKEDYAEKDLKGVKVEVSKIIDKYDLLVNIPVMKTHMLLNISGAVENLTRFLSKKTIDELQNDPKNAVSVLASLPTLFPEQLIVGDSTKGMEGNGPLMHGEPSFLNIIMASKDPYNMDKVFQEMCLLRKTPYIELAGKIGNADLENIEVVGEELETCKKEIKQPIGSKLIKER